MSRVWFSGRLETVAMFWRVLRRDGVALGFTTHDRDLWFGGLPHRAAPGMIPSSLRRSGDFEPDSAEVRGALTHGALSAADLAMGRFDGAQVRIGLVDWETLEHDVLYAGSLGDITEEDGRFTAGLISRKAELLRDPVPRTSPMCRAAFCGPGCALSALPFTHEARVVATAPEDNAVTLDTGASPESLVGGVLRWLDGPQAGLSMDIMATGTSGIVLATPLDPALTPDTRAIVREGCDHTLGTCAARFGNAASFQGEPFLPGNDMIVRYPVPAA